MEEKQGRGRPKKKKMTPEERQEWYTMRWSLLQIATSQIKDEAWNKSNEAKREQIKTLRWISQEIIAPWVRQLNRELAEDGEPKENKIK